MSYEYEEDLDFWVNPFVLLNGREVTDGELGMVWERAEWPDEVVSDGNDDDVMVPAPPVRKPLWRGWSDESRLRVSNTRWSAVAAAHDAVYPEGFSPELWYRLSRDMVRKSKAVK